MRERTSAGILAVVTAVVVATASLSLLGCTPATPATPPTGSSSSARAAADQVVAAFKAQDSAILSSFVHPEKGLRFSPYAFVDVKTDVVLTGEQVASLWDSTKVYTWGRADGTGDPIKMTPAQYAQRYIFDRDFTTATTVSENADEATGTTENNAGSVYPDGTRVEYYIAGAPVAGEAGSPSPGNDWKALRLVFEKVGDSWFLVGVIHDEWTI